MSAGFNFGGGGGLPFGTPNPQTTQAGFSMNPAAAITQPTTTSGGFSFGSSGKCLDMIVLTIVHSVTT